MRNKNRPVTVCIQSMVWSVLFGLRTADRLSGLVWSKIDPVWAVRGLQTGPTLTFSLSHNDHVIFESSRVRQAYASSCVGCQVGPCKVTPSRQKSHPISFNINATKSRLSTTAFNSWCFYHHRSSSSVWISTMPRSLL